MRLADDAKDAKRQGVSFVIFLKKNCCVKRFGFF